MKTILTSVIVVSLLTTLAVAQQPSRFARQRAFSYNQEPRSADISVPGKASLLVYAITVGFQFGAVDLGSGVFLPIGPGLPPEQNVGDGLVPGPGTSLLSLGFDGNLDAIDPFTGKISVIGATGLGDCSTPTSPCGPNSANWIGRFDGKYYVTDFAQNLYLLDPKTGATKLIGPTGIPALTFVPFSLDPDGVSFDVFGESLFSAHGKLYAYFSTVAANPEAGTLRPLIPGAIYQIDPATGHATPIMPTDSNLSAIVNVNDTIYAFKVNLMTDQVQVVALDVTTGQTTPVSNSNLQPSAGGVIAGAAPARPAAPAVH